MSDEYPIPDPTHAYTIRVLSGAKYAFIAETISNGLLLVQVHNSQGSRGVDSGGQPCIDKALPKVIEHLTAELDAWNLFLKRSYAQLTKSRWKLWLDDQIDDPDAPARHTPDGFIGARSSLEAIDLVEARGLPAFMDLDHDLGDCDDAMRFLKWLNGTFPDQMPPQYVVHSANGEGRKNIISYLESWRKSLE